MRVEKRNQRRCAGGIVAVSQTSNLNPQPCVACRAWLAATIGLGGALALLSNSGCTTKAAQRALDKPTPDAAYADFTRVQGKESERRAKELEPVSDDIEPEKAVDILVDHMQRTEPAYFIPAEAQLRYWGAKQGVAEIIVRKVRLLLRSPRIEVRAPALRLVAAYGQRESAGDLIEVLADEDYGMRKLAFDTLRARTRMDLGFDPGGGALARAEATDKWRQWWQDELRALAAGRGPAVKMETPAPPTIMKPEPAIEEATAPQTPSTKEEAPSAPKERNGSN